MVCLAVMPAACGRSLPHPAKAPDPIIETRVETRLICPPEVTAQPVARIDPIDAVIKASEAALNWIAAHFARETLLEERLADAKAACVKAGVKGTGH